MKNLAYFLNFVIFLKTKINAVETFICPIGFDIANDKSDNGYICYRQKGPETFQEKFINCNGNLYSLKLYQRLNITNTKAKLWTDFITLYPGGPFIDLQYDKDEPDILFDINNRSTIDNSKELCLIRDGEDYKAVDCEEKYERYCFVKPNIVKRDWEICEEFEPSFKYYSPEEVCIMNMTVHPGVSWLQAKDFCESKNSSLLSKGWIYANLPLFNQSSVYPLDKNCNGVEDLHSHTRTMVDISEETVDGNTSCLERNNTGLLVIQNGTTQIVDLNYMFSELLCEKSFNHNITLDLSISLKNKIVLSLSYELDESNIYCFTDSLTYYPTKIKTNYVINGSNTYLLSPFDDGYYWCVYIHPKTLKKTMSNEVLFVKESQSLWHIYAIKIYVNKYDIANIDVIKSYWIQKLTEYIFYYTSKRYFDDDLEITENNNIYNRKLNFATISVDIIKSFKIKRLFLDRKTVVLHIELNPGMTALTSGLWDGIQVVYMRPVYSVGKLDDSSRCTGNFNEGIVCDYTKKEKTSESELNEDLIIVNDAIHKQMKESYEISDLMMESCNGCEINLINTLEIADSTIGTPIIEPEEMIEKILEDLEQLLQDETVPILIDDIYDTFNQVNNLLDQNQDIVFPGELFQMLEQVSARVDLDGSLTDSVVGGNIAMLLADSGPENPVLGFRLAARDADEFNKDSFAFYTEFQDQLVANQTEVAVFLPPSLTSLNRRISFIVYRDDRVFNDSKRVNAVNSRVISVSVANFTGFQSGEAVNIHSTPRNPDPGRNISRGCAYWRFLEDGSGYWSQDGCIFIRSRDPDVLDICRCNHLTHFAEILIPRSLFSQTNEDILEVLSVLGCSVSILGLLVIIITSILFRSWRKNFVNQMWLQLCISLFIMMICFLFVVFTKFDRSDVPCMLTGIILHYTLLASFCWMFVVATKSYRDLVLIFTRQVTHNLLAASFFSWGLPVVIVGILLIADPSSYLKRFEEMNPSSNFCYPSGLGLWLAVYAPVSAMLLANIVFFVLIVRNIGVTPKNLRYQRAGDKREALYCARISLVLVFLFGLPWFFGLFAYNIVAAYFFTCTATWQGFVLFVFIVLGNHETRSLWLLKLRTRKVNNRAFSGRSVTVLY